MTVIHKHTKKLKYVTTNIIKRICAIYIKNTHINNFKMTSKLMVCDCFYLFLLFLFVAGTTHI